MSNTQEKLPDGYDVRLLGFKKWACIAPDGTQIAVCTNLRYAASRCQRHSVGLKF
ncbi:hypothetical protein [Hyphomicrobium sp.]|uniref:hypothetical protein n=1 Tax=Hyphomicrobium sp. TaxID=82 RepID=UPI001DC82C30|nr:hypothetical protein [Hyphomicrobium sp.]MBY0560048.1 hypothetical protein [Hyphomicrobium sp.]